MASKGAKTPEEPVTGSGLAQNNAGSLVVSDGDLPDGFDEWMGGSQDFGQEDLSIPFLRIIQGLSPQVTRGDPKHDKAAQIGMIVETVSPRFFDGDKGIYVIAVLYQRSYTEWKPQRGGMVKDWGTDPSNFMRARKETNAEGKTRMVTPEGTEMAEAAQYFVMYTEDPTSGYWEQAMLTMAGTQWKTSRDWNTNMAKVRLPLPGGRILQNPLPFVQAYHLTTVPASSGEYNFNGWKIAPLDFTHKLHNGAALLQKCRDFRELALKGKIKGADDGQHSESAANGDDIPFDPM
jgi:hypothetical protein